MSDATGCGADVILERLDSRAAVVWRTALAGLLMATALGTVGARVRIWSQPANGSHLQALWLPIVLGVLMMLIAAVIGRKGTGRWPVAAARELALIAYHGGRVPPHLRQWRRPRVM